MILGRSNRGPLFTIRQYEVDMPCIRTASDWRGFLGRLTSLHTCFHLFYTVLLHATVPSEWVYHFQLLADFSKVKSTALRLLPISLKIKIKDTLIMAGGLCGCQPTIQFTHNQRICRLLMVRHRNRAVKRVQMLNIYPRACMTGLFPFCDLYSMLNLPAKPVLGTWQTLRQSRSDLHSAAAVFRIAIRVTPYPI